MERDEQEERQKRPIPSRAELRRQLEREIAEAEREAEEDVATPD